MAKNESSYLEEIAKIILFILIVISLSFVYLKFIFFKQNKVVPLNELDRLELYKTK